jgi:hypothetical protein
MSKIIGHVKLSRYADYIVISYGDQMIILYYFDYYNDHSLVLSSSVSKVIGVDEIHD